MVNVFNQNFEPFVSPCLMLEKDQYGINISVTCIQINLLSLCNILFKLIEIFQNHL